MQVASAAGGTARGSFRAARSQRRSADRRKCDKRHDRLVQAAADAADRIWRGGGPGLGRRRDDAGAGIPGEKFLAVEFGDVDLGWRDDHGAPPGFDSDALVRSGSGAHSACLGHTPRMRLTRREDIRRTYEETYGDIYGVF
jgi:hypothetical protein